MKTSVAQLGTETRKYNALKNLPAPKEKIISAVYKFRDQTGQYKSTELGSSWSTAVTQGATSILIRTMEESGWFIPIEREGLPNLLNERKIIRSSRATYGGNESSADLLPPLLYAGVLLEGGIISFDSNVLTGGAGARYLGISSSGQYREDRVTIYLRAVSTVNGKILKTIYTSKTILSQKVDVGVFKFVAPNKILEAEVGFTYNEPAEMAVREAIEKAVIGLIIEGIDEGLWTANSLTPQDSLTIQSYKQERASKQLTDPFGSALNTRRGLIGIHASGGVSLLKGDYNQQEVNPGAQIGMEWFAQHPVSVGINFFYAKIGTKNVYEADVLGSNFSVNYRMLNSYRTTPFVNFGFGFLDDFRNNSEIDNSFDPFSNFSLHGSLGVEYLITDQIGVSSQATYTSLLHDKLDGIEQGSYNDYLLSFNLGLNYYFRPKKENKIFNKKRKKSMKKK
ncbi:CsgG/HfaB family protein [Reichenbachiella faecimaris]|nr:CsgG/HfaB family protein [Reichenbachiella faecimaris]